MKLQFRQTLGYRFVRVFLIFAVIIVAVITIFTYRLQDRVYREQKEEIVRDVSEGFTKLLQNDGDEFLWMVNYYHDHSSEMMIEYEGNYSRDVPDWLEKKEIFNEAFDNEYGNRHLGEDVKFEDMPLELQRLFAEYEFCFWEKALFDTIDAYGLEYLYVAVPEDEEKYLWSYVVDPVSEDKVVDGKIYRGLGETFGGDYEGHAKMWDVWNEKDVDGFEEYDNEFGQTLACYNLVTIDGEKVAVVGAEINADKVNNEIVLITVKMMLITAAVILFFMILLVIIINRKYIRRLETLEHHISEYTESKNAAIAMDIENTATVKDEISSLALEVAAMIREIESHMKTLVSMKWRVNSAEFMATRDRLTGVKNKRAYDEYANKLNNEIASGNCKFGIAMIDLNYLKKINDTYGHERGDEIIQSLGKVLCEIFGNSPVFRLGGDEFAVILEGEDYENMDALVESFREKLKTQDDNPELKEWERLSAAIGVAKYEPDRDDIVEKVFKRADEEMYEDKKKQKAERL